MKIKKLNWFLALTVIFSVISSCSRKDEEDALDCFAESFKTSLHFESSSSNPKQINFEAKYSGSLPVTSVVYHYGDNTSATTTNLMSTHIYSSAGTYEATADITINGKCTVSPKKTVVVQ